jgi:hypothetical protein
LIPDFFDRKSPSQQQKTFKMRFTLIATSLIAAAAAQYGAPAAAAGEETCSAMVTVTVTEYVSPSSPSLSALTKSNI